MLNKMPVDRVGGPIPAKPLITGRDQMLREHPFSLSRRRCPPRPIWSYSLQSAGPAIGLENLFDAGFALARALGVDTLSSSQTRDHALRTVRDRPARI